MFVCAKCNRTMRPKRNGVCFVEMAGTHPYKLWMADLWECQDCGATILHTDPRQQPIAEHFEEDFAVKAKAYTPQYYAKERT